MFAEELAGNPAKKRADEAKNRRLRAKREKDVKDARKQKELERREASVAAVAAETNSPDPTTVDVKSVVSAVSNICSDAPVLRNNTGGEAGDVKVTGSFMSTKFDAPSDGPLTATQHAAEQRKIRTEARVRNSSALIIQSVVRSKKVASNAKDFQRNSFDKRMSDLIALASILKNVQHNKGSSNSLVGKEEYIPPPATASMMTLQFLFFAWPSVSRNPCQESTCDGSVILEEQDLPRFAKLIQHILLPGVVSDNQDLDPLLPWVETFAGRRRLTKILGLCVSSISRRTNRCPSECSKADRIFLYTGVDSLLRRVLRMGEGTAVYSGVLRDEVHQLSQSLLFQASPPDDVPIRGSGANHYDSAIHRSTCEIIRSLRFILHYGSDGNSIPIPPNCGQLREHCIACDEKERSSILFKLVVDYLSLKTLTTGGPSRECSRFLVEVLTAPLLVWKVTADAYGRMLTIPKAKAPPPLVDYIHSFVALNANTVSSGSIDAALHMRDVTLTSCPAPPVLCLLANLIQIGKQCLALNGSDPIKLHFKAAAEYFYFLTILINAAPLGTFSRRMSAVEWVYIGSSSTPIVLSDVVVEQACALLADSYVRSLFKCGINDHLLGTEKIIRTKSDKDKSYEKDLDDIGSESVANLAAREAMVDRSRSFWQSSWAAKISRTMNSLISGPGEKPKSNQSSCAVRGPGQLMNTSTISRQLAHGKGSVNRIVTNALLSSEDKDKNKDSSVTTAEPDHEYSVVFLFSLCQTFGTIISRWGGCGKEDLVNRALPDTERSEHMSRGIEQASGAIEPCVTTLLSVLSFSTNILTTTWAIIQSNPVVVSDLYAIIDITKKPEPIRSLHLGDSEGNVGAAVLFVFVSCLSHTLMVTDDVEIHDMEKPLPKHQLRRCILLLKKLLYRACCLDDVHKVTVKSKSNHFGLSLISRSSKVMNDLYSRSSRRLLCAPKFWIEDSLLETDLRRCKSHSDYIDLLASPVCRICPFLVSFKRRLKLFERIVTTNRVDIQGSNDLRNLKPGIMVKVMRGRVLEDGLIHLNNLGRNMRQRIVVNYLSQAGTRETGVDVGGLFKEFWTDLSNLAFDPNYALFRVTEGSKSLYPNPSSKLAHGSDHIILFEFLGRILGKALYEGITIQPQFAHLFLSFLRGDHQYLHLLTDLSTIDPQLYNNLMFLKTYSGDVSDLCLTFTVANDDFGVSEVPLIPNGTNIEVTNDNKRRYIYLVAKHHVCDRIKEQADAFTRGLWEVIDRSWLRLFNEPELQVLISGPSDGKIDISDMKSNTRYTGGYSVLDRNIIRFWSVVSSFTSKQQADLLRFVTSCERPPPLGFASMNPPFTIQRVGIMRDGDKLPTASTCFNTLKLPTYSSEKVLKERLLYSIQAGAGFELT